MRVETPLVGTCTAPPEVETPKSEATMSSSARISPELMTTLCVSGDAPWRKNVRVAFCADVPPLKMRMAVRQSAPPLGEPGAIVGDPGRTYLSAPAAPSFAPVKGKGMVDRVSTTEA